MNALLRAEALAREAVASARSMPVASLLTMVMVAGMCVATLLTSGRTAAAESAALAQIDAAGTRTITVRAAPDAELDVGFISRLDRIDEIETVVAFGPISDAHNAAIPGAPAVGVRPVYAGLKLPRPGGSELEPRAYASRSGAEALGLLDGTGDVVTSTGSHMTVAGVVAMPTHLDQMEPLVVVPRQASHDDVLATVVLLIDDPTAVAAVSEAVSGLLGVADRSKVTLETSEHLATMRAAVAGELGAFRRSTVLGILAVCGLLVGANLFGLVMMRRKDFGRRRALGASRALIVALLMTQVALLAAVGTVTGTLAALGYLAVSGSPMPDVQFSVAVALAACLTAIAASLLPAHVASRREPLYELRVP